MLLESHADEDNEVNGSENSDTVNLVDDEESNVRGDNVSLSATVAEESNLAIGVEPKEANVELADDDVEEVDEEELKRDKIIEEVVISSVTQPFEKVEVVEEEIKQKFADIGINVVSMNSFSSKRGYFDQSRVRTTPVNLKTIWGRRLGLNNCSVIEYYPPPPGWKPHP